VIEGRVSHDHLGLVISDFVVELLELLLYYQLTLVVNEHQVSIFHDDD
jgi:hypothetical protein